VEEEEVKEEKKEEVQEETKKPEIEIKTIDLPTTDSPEKSHEIKIIKEDYSSSSSSSTSTDSDDGKPKVSLEKAKEGEIYMGRDGKKYKVITSKHGKRFWRPYKK